MSELVSPEVNNNFREDTLPENSGKPEPTTTDVVVLGEDLLDPNRPKMHLPYFLQEGFIGPVDATNEARGLIEKQIQGLAMVAVMNFPAYDAERFKITNAVRSSVDEGKLRLGDEFKTATVDQQIETFIHYTMTNGLRPQNEVAAEIAASNESVRTSSKQAKSEFDLKLEEKDRIIAEQAQRILAVRNMLVNGGASEEFMREFYYTTKLMTKPDQEEYELEKALEPNTAPVPVVNTEQITLLTKFKDVISTLSREGIKFAGIHPPHSTPATMSDQEQKVAS